MYGRVHRARRHTRHARSSGSSVECAYGKIELLISPPFLETQEIAKMHLLSIEERDCVSNSRSAGGGKLMLTFSRELMCVVVLIF